MNVKKRIKKKVKGMLRKREVLRKRSLQAPDRGYDEATEYFVEQFGCDRKIVVRLDSRCIYFSYSFKDGNVFRNKKKKCVLSQKNKYSFSTPRQLMGGQWGSMEERHDFTVNILASGGIRVLNRTRWYPNSETMEPSQDTTKSETKIK